MSGGFFFIGDCHLDLQRRISFSLRYINLASYEPDPSTSEKVVIKEEEWGELKLAIEGTIADFGLSLEENDLIALLEVLPQ